MKQFGTQLKKQATNYRLTQSERADLRERLVSYMEYHPLPAQANNVRPASQRVYKARVVMRGVYTRYFVGALSMLIFAVVPVLAEQAVPGDVLYPVKVRFNEEVRSSLALSPYAKVEWETKRLERRLAEARLLADEGKLTPELEAEVAAAVQGHSNAAQQEIATIRESDSDEAALAEISFASALEVQSEVLEKRQTSATGEGQSTVALAGVVAEARTGVDASQQNANPSYEKLLGRIELETTRTQELFDSIKPDALDEEVASIERRFTAIGEKVLQAQALKVGEIESASGEEAEKAAQTLLKVALADTRKLVSFMADIDVRRSVSIDDLLPETVEVEEDPLVAQQAFDTLVATLAVLEASEPSVALATEYSLALTTVRELLKKSETALENRQYTEARAAAEAGSAAAERFRQLQEVEVTAEETTKASSTGAN